MRVVRYCTIDLHTYLLFCRCSERTGTSNCGIALCTLRRAERTNQRRKGPLERPKCVRKSNNIRIREEIIPARTYTHTYMFIFLSSCQFIIIPSPSSHTCVSLPYFKSAYTHTYRNGCTSSSESGPPKLSSNTPVFPGISSLPAYPPFTCTTCSASAFLLPHFSLFFTTAVLFSLLLAPCDVARALRCVAAILSRACLCALSATDALMEP